jgi:hypothetical protein
MGYGTGSWQGIIQIAEGNKVRVTQQGHDRNETFASTYVSAGKRFCTKTTKGDETTLKTRDADGNLSKNITSRLCPFGIFDELTGNGSLLGYLRQPVERSIKECKTVTKEKLDGRETTLIEVEFERTTKKTDVFVRLRRMWFDSQTKLLVKRQFESRFGNELYLRVEEEYRDWDFAPKFKDDVFALPMEEPAGGCMACRERAVQYFEPARSR